MSKKRFTSNKKRAEPIPQSKEIDGTPYYLSGSFRSHGQALHLSKAIQRRGDYAQVVEVQRGRHKFHCVYSKKGAGTMKQQVKTHVFKKLKLLPEENKRLRLFPEENENKNQE